ncbi:dephospho-CoA kinase [Diaphorobacter aerolatus]|uniref:Dephospho-CoA kinase n=1 Tax=Diaphorobacter aerolatus TaxID=1288495 RepID=A0A7H0GN44_9BURK|nr:dephospho-CoA kinase [Diaphorobacter aerolatus]QNP49710.1 dephospho-CoA kinase [Diaphorobacter aerolatus]
MARLNRKSFYVGLTGGIGSGKSTVGGMLRDHGAALIDADQIARSVTVAGGAAIPAIRNEFGAEFFDATGALDRARMRDLVFADASAKDRLEAIVHPLVGQATWAAAKAAEGRDHGVIVFDIPLLVESRRWSSQLDAVVVVDCTHETQIARVQRRNGLAREAVEAIIAAQASRQQRRAAADWVIFNDGLSLLDLQTKARMIALRFGL